MRPDVTLHGVATKSKRASGLCHRTTPKPKTKATSDITIAVISLLIRHPVSVADTRDVSTPTLPLLDPN